MKIKRSGSQPSRKPPEDYFTGTVRLDTQFQPPSPARVADASPTTAMTHIAIQEALDGKVVDWMEKVSDVQYRR